MQQIVRLILFIIILIFILPAQAKTNSTDYQSFKQLFNAWTTAFNHKNLEQSCALFSHNVIADYQGAPQKNYRTICDGFKKVFSDKHLRYQYHFKLHQIYRSDNLAAARITWYLTIYKDNKLQSSTQDEGIDIFEKINNQWKISNYIGYEVKH